jgi:hypothetical protein
MAAFKQKNPNAVTSFGEDLRQKLLDISEDVNRSKDGKCVLAKIKDATSASELASLIEEASKFDGASPGTVRKWKRAADKRTAELSV